MSLCAESTLLEKSAAWMFAGWPTVAKAARLLYYGSSMTTVRNLKDEIDKRAYHTMLKQLGLSERNLQ